jgi:hypothetical protein
MADPNLSNDLVKVAWTIIAGTVAGASLARTCLISTFAASDAFPNRTMILGGGIDGIQAELISLGFTVASVTYLMVTSFLTVDSPVDEVMIGRRDAGDANWTATLTAIAAHDSSFLFVGAETRTKGEQLEIIAWCEPRWKFYKTITREPGTLTKADGTLAATGFALKYLHSACTYHIAADATGYGPAKILSAAPNAKIGGFNFSNNWTIGLKTYVDGVLSALQTATFNATIASLTGSEAGPAFVLVAAEHLDLEIDELTAIVLPLVDDPAYFPDGIGAATGSQLVEYFGELAPFVTFSSVGGALKISSQRAGSKSKVKVLAATSANVLTILGFTADQTNSGTGDFFYADKAQAAEVATVINTDTTAITASTVGTKLLISSDASGKDVYIEIVSGDALAELGIEIGKYYGTGVQEDWLDCKLLGYGADLARRLDEPEGFCSWDGTMLPNTPGAVLTETARKNVREQNCNTYEKRDNQDPGEFHWAVTFSGFNIEDVVFGFWFQLRLSEEVTAMRKRYKKLKKNIPLSAIGIGLYATCFKKIIKLGAASGALSFADLDPFGPGKTTGLTIPTMNDQKGSDLAVGKLGGFKTLQPLAGAAKAVEYSVVFQTPTNG